MENRMSFFAFIHFFIFLCLPFSALANSLAALNIRVDNVIAASTGVNAEEILDKVPFLGDSRSMIEDNEWEELGVDKIASEWEKYSKTKFDSWGLKKLLRFGPKGSQSMIKTLVEDEKAFRALDRFLDCVNQSEDALLAYWEKGNRLHYDADSLYYSSLKKFLPEVNDYLNKSEVALEVSQILEAAKPCASLLAMLGVNGGVSGYVMSKFFGTPFSWKKSILRGLKQPIRYNDIRPVVYKREQDIRLSDRKKLFDYLNGATLGDRYMVSKSFLKRVLKKFTKNDKISNVSSITIAGAFLGLDVAWYDYKLLSLVKGSVGRLRFLQKISSEMQNQLVMVSSILKSLKMVDELVDCNPELNDCNVVKTIKRFLNRESISNKLNKFLFLIDSSTFKRNASFLYSKGRLLKTHKLLVETKDELIPILQQISLLGGYRMIAELYKEHQSSGVKFCFVNFVEQERPLINLKNAWLPLIDKSKVVPNSIQLGGEDCGVNAVVTGPNGGGKTTFMVTVACNILLSRLGIAAADEAYMTRFQKIRTSLMPKQNIKDGLSAFMAEQKRVDEVKRDIDYCDGHILVLLDEPYKGTVEAESASRVHKFGSEIANSSNCIFLMSTHLEKPIYLADDTCGVFENYQMGYIEKKHGMFARTFKLQKGPALWWFHNAKKRASFVDWLCSDGFAV